MECLSCRSVSGEKPNIHIHFVAKPENLPADAKGPRIFSMLNVDEQQAIPTIELKAFCEKLKEKYQAI